MLTHRTASTVCLVPLTRTQAVVALFFSVSPINRPAAKSAEAFLAGNKCLGFLILETILYMYTIHMVVQC